MVKTEYARPVIYIFSKSTRNTPTQYTYAIHTCPHRHLDHARTQGLAKEAAGYQEEDSDDDEEEDEEAGDNEGDSDDDDEEEVPAKKKVDENDPTELAKIMMPKKNKRMYSRIQHTLAKKDAVNQKLTSKRKTLEKETRRAKKQRK